LPISWNASLVFLSVLVAMIGSFTALTHAQRMRESTGRAAMLWMVVGSITLGTAVWSMHFLGMLAFHLPVPIAYDLELTIFSALPAIAAALLGFKVLRESRIGTKRILASGLLMGLGISVMHYTGMAALKMSPPVGYNPVIFALSVAIAIIASWGALLMMYQGERVKLPPLPRFMLGAVIMGSAISGMHYTAMLGVNISPGSTCLAGATRIEPDILAVLVSLTSLFWFGGGILATLFDRRMARQNAQALAELEQAHSELQARAAGQAAEMTRSLRESEERLRMTLRCAPDAVFICEKDGRIVYVNDNAIDVLGYSYDELHRMTVFDLAPADWRERYRQGARQIVSSSERHIFEIRLVRKDGSKIPMELNAVLLPNGQVYGSCRDITERKAVQHALLDSQENLQRLLDSVAEGIYGVDTRGNCTFVNAAFLRILGYWNASEVVGKHIHSLIHYAHADGHPYLASECRIYCAFRNNQKINASDEVFWRKDGTSVAVEYWSHPIIKNGIVIGAVTTFLDITERKLAEEVLRRSEAKLRTLYDSTSDAVMLLDEKGFFDCNKATLAIFGCATREEFCSKHPADLSPSEQPCGTSSLVLSNRQIARAMKDGSNRFQWVHKRADTGRTFPADVLLNAMELDGKQVLQATVRDITEHKQNEQKIHQLAFYDPLTDLPNRRLLMDRLQQSFAVSARNDQHGAVLFLDLDNFKTLNDAKGHDIGDLLLVEVARRLESCVRDGDTVARLGGDEFVVVLETLSVNTGDAASQAELVAEKIHAALNLPYQLKEHIYHTTPSIGIVLFRGHQESLDDLLKHADTAMYQAKTAGRNAIRFYDPAIQIAIEARADMETELRLALENRQFRLYYQIQVDSLRRPLGAEVLLRWEHPERGLVSPDQFIPLTEEAGIIVPLGLWVLQTACAQLRAWQHDALTRDLTLAVNVSARQFRQADFVARVQSTLLESGAKPSHLKLELTESIVLENVEGTIAKMRELKLLGVSFSMDDFGTGYSSLQYLKRLPLDQIKIDQSFVRDIASDPNDAAIVHTIIAMTEALGLNVIAEGVETEAQREFLDKHGCHAFQGYLFSKPIEVKQFEALLGKL